VEYFPYPKIAAPAYPYLLGTPQYATYGGASFSTNQILVGAGQSVNIEVTFSPASGVDATQNPITSGFIKITNNNDHFTIPYLGVPYSRFNAEYFDHSTNVDNPAQGIDHFDTFNDVFPNYYIDKSVLAFNWTDFEFPYIAMNFNYYSLQTRLDIVPPNTTYVPDVYGYDTSIPVDNVPAKANLTSKFVGYDTYGMAWLLADRIPAFYWLDWYWRVVFTDAGDEIQLGDGDYRLLLSILRWGGDPEKRESWESFLTPVVRYINAGDSVVCTDQC
jgi:hypothetical protein